MGATVGAENTPNKELKALSGLGGASDRVVVAPEAGGQEAEGLGASRFYTVVEELEGEFSSNGAYPAIPASSQELTGAGYETNSRRFRLSGEEWSYDSSEGLSRVTEQQGSGSFRVAGKIAKVSEGWGPWRTERREFQAMGRSEELEWLVGAQETPAWAARMYFPISVEQTGYAFRHPDGSSAYASGEVLYDGVNGTFQIRLLRSVEREARAYSPEALEKELADGSLSCELAGDASLLHDLGFLSKVEKDEPLVHLSNPIRLNLSGTSALDGQVLSAFSRHKKVLKSGGFLASENSPGSAVVVGRMELVDKLGQVHSVRVRAGRGDGYDWIVGQLCVAADGEADAVSFQGYDDAYQREVRRTIVAGK